MVDSFFYQVGMIVGLECSLVMKGIVMIFWFCFVGEFCVIDVCVVVVQLWDVCCDGVVVFGGGLVLDVVKVVVLLVVNFEQMLGEMMEYSELCLCLLLIVVLIIVGIGFEIINVMVIIDVVSGCKQVLVYVLLMLDVVIFDVVLIEGVLLYIMVMIGIDVLIYVVEVYSVCYVMLFIDSLVMGVIVMIGEVLLKVVGCGQDLVVWENMLLVFCMVGMVFFSVGLGLCYVMVYQLGVVLYILYGLVNVMLLLMVMEFNCMVCWVCFSQIGWVLIGKKIDDCEVIVVVCELIVEVGLMMWLMEVGVMFVYYDVWV